MFLLNFECIVGTAAAHLNFEHTYYVAVKAKPRCPEQPQAHNLTNFMFEQKELLFRKSLTM